MIKQEKQFITIILLMLIAAPLHAMEAYAWLTDSENEFYKKEFASTVKANGTENFGDLTDKKGNINIDCGKALFLYGGRDAIKEALQSVKKGDGFVVRPNCDSPEKLGVFVATVSAKAKSKKIIMISPVDKDRVSIIGKKYLYLFRVGESVDKNLVKSLVTVDIENLIDNLK